MTTSEILLLDCRSKEKRIQLRKCLLKIPMVQKLEKEWNELATDDIEKLVLKVQKVYPLTVAYIMRNDDYYTLMLKRSDNHEWLQTIYARSMFEGFSKSLIFMYSYIKKNALSKKEISS